MQNEFPNKKSCVYNDFFSNPREPPVLKILRRVNFGTGSKFGTDVAKRYGEGSEVHVFLGKRDRKRCADTEKLRRWQNSTDSSAVLFLVRKGPLGLLRLILGDNLQRLK